MAAMYKQQLGEIIRRRRLELHLTQNQVADLAGVGQSLTVSRWERGISAPSDLDAVATALQTTAGEMLAEIRDLEGKQRRELHPKGASQLDRIERMLGEVKETQERLEAMFTRATEDESGHPVKFPEGLPDLDLEDPAKGDRDKRASGSGP